MPTGLDSYTKLLVHSDGNEGSYAVVDSGYSSAMGGTQPGGHLPTYVANAVISSAASKFGGASLLCDGTGDYVTVPDSADWDIVGSANSATVDLWVKHTDHVDTEVYICQYEDGDNFWSLQHLHETGLQFIVESTGSTVVDVAGAEITDTNWHHVALVKNGTTYTIYLDGVGGTPVTDASTDTFAGTLDIGSLHAASADFAGYIDEVRLSRGIARWTADFTAPTTPYTADGKTNLLLHFDAADQPVTGGTAKVGTFVGTAMHKANDAAVAMIGNGSLCLDGNSDYISIADSADWDFAQGTLTIDFWINLTSFSSATEYCVSAQGGGTGADSRTFYGFLYDNKLYFADLDNNAYLINFSCPFTPVTGVWYHIAIVRVNTDNAATGWRIFINGVSQTLTLNSGAWNATLFNHTGLLVIGSGFSGTTTVGGSWFPGYIDEFRICKGTAVWTADFIPSIVPYTATTAANTVLLCHFDNYQVDSETTPKALTQVGTAYNTGDYVVGATSPAVGAGAWRFDGSDDYITYPDAADWDLGTGNWTIDFWVRNSDIAFSVTQIWIDVGTASTAGISLGLANEANKIQLGIASTYTNEAWTPQINTWYHVALVRNGNTATLYINGTSIGTIDVTGVDIQGSSGIRIGNRFDAPEKFFNGYIDNLRVLKGTAAWTTTFTPPTTAYTGSDIPTSGNGIYLPFDYDGRDAGATGHVPTYVSNTYGATANARFTGSVLFDGNSDYVTFPDSDDYNFGSGDFTIDAWVKFLSVAADNAFYGQSVDATHFIEFFWKQSTARLEYYHINGAGSDTFAYCAWTPTINTWYHIAMVRNGANALLFIDGVSQAVTLDGWVDVPDYSASTVIGYAANEGPSYMNGYIDEMRVSKGIARWTSNFNPSTEPYGEVTTLSTSQADTITVTDNTSKGTELLKLTFDTVNMSDSNTQYIDPLLKSTYDTITISELVTSRVTLLLKLIADTINVSEDVKSGIGELNKSIADLITISDYTAQLVPTLLQGIADNIVVGEFLNKNIPTLLKSVFDNVVMTDNEDSAVDLYKLIVDDITVTDNVSVLVAVLLQQIVDSLTVSDTTSQLLTKLLQAVYDNINMTDNVVAGTELIKLLYDQINVSDLTDELIPVLVKQIVDNINVAELVRPSIPTLLTQIVDNIVVSEDDTDTIDVDLYTPHLVLDFRGLINVQKTETSVQKYTSDTSGCPLCRSSNY